MGDDTKPLAKASSTVTTTSANITLSPDIFLSMDCTVTHAIARLENPTGPILISDIALVASVLSTRYALDKRLLTNYVVSAFDSSVVRKKLLIYLFIYFFGINIIN